MNWLSVNQVIKHLADQKVVDEVSFSFQVGHKVGIAGETGAGKSSLLKMIAGLLQPDSGAVFFEDDRVKGPAEQLLPGHPAIAYLSQHFELINHYKIKEYLQLTSLLDIEEATHLYAVCKIDHLLDRKTTELSGGERQRVALAAALGKKPRLLLLDEPFSNLDMAQKDKIKAVLDRVVSLMHVTPLIVSHDATDLLSWANTMLLLRKGKIVQQGPPRSLYLCPKDAYCAGLLGTYSQVPGDWLASIFGQQQKRGTLESIFLRPEQLSIHTLSPPPGAVEATIATVSFMGPYSLAEVQCGGQTIKVSTRQSSLQQGQIVHLALREWIW